MKVKTIKKPLNLEYLPHVLRVDEVAEYLRVSKRTIYNWIEYGELKAYRMGIGKKGTIRIFKEDFIAFLRSRQQIL